MTKEFDTMDIIALQQERDAARKEAADLRVSNDSLVRECHQFAKHLEEARLKAAAAQPAMSEDEIAAWVDAAHSRPIDDIDRAVTRLHIATGAALMRRGSRGDGALLRELRAWACDLHEMNHLVAETRRLFIAKIDSLLASQPEPKSDAGLRPTIIP
jgi:hypothetical protein